MASGRVRTEAQAKVWIEALATFPTPSRSSEQS